MGEKLAVWEESWPVHWATLNLPFSWGLVLSLYGCQTLFREQSLENWSSEINPQVVSMCRRFGYFWVFCLMVQQGARLYEILGFDDETSSLPLEFKWGIYEKLPPCEVSYTHMPCDLYVKDFLLLIDINLVTYYPSQTILSTKGKKKFFVNKKLKAFSKLFVLLLYALKLCHFLPGLDFFTFDFSQTNKWGVIRGNKKIVAHFILKELPPFSELVGVETPFWDINLDVNATGF